MGGILKNLTSDEAWAIIVDQYAFIAKVLHEQAIRGRCPGIIQYHSDTDIICYMGFQESEQLILHIEFYDNYECGYIIENAVKKKVYANKNFNNKYSEESREECIKEINNLTDDILSFAEYEGKSLHD